MDSESRKNIEKAISLLRENFKNHSNPDSWATNIQRACKHLTNKIEWVHFYHYMANPAAYNINAVKIDCELDDSPADTLNFEGLDKRLKPVIYKNGSECVIHIRNVGNDTPSQEDEKQES